MGVSMASRACLAMFIVLGAACPLIPWVCATQHIVGGSSGWAVGSDLHSWASNNKFHVGDELYFPYPPGQHIVLLVNEEDYKACNIQNPIASDNGKGNMVITLSSETTHYFICGVPGHCSHGLKLEVPLEPMPTSGDELTPPQSVGNSANDDEAGYNNIRRPNSAPAPCSNVFLFATIISIALAPCITMLF